MNQEENYDSHTIYLRFLKKVLLLFLYGKYRVNTNSHDCR